MESCDWWTQNGGGRFLLCMEQRRCQGDTPRRGTPLIALVGWGGWALVPQEHGSLCTGDGQHPLRPQPQAQPGLLLLLAAVEGWGGVFSTSL